MMSVDQILAAHAKRPPAHYRHDSAIQPDQKKWWECHPSLGGDLRKITDTNKENT